MKLNEYVTRVVRRTVDFGVLAGDMRPLEPGISRVYETRMAMAAIVEDILFTEPATLWITSIRAAGREQIIGSLPATVLDVAQPSHGLYFPTLAPGDAFSFTLKNDGDAPCLPSVRLVLCESAG